MADVIVEQVKEHLANEGYTFLNPLGKRSTGKNTKVFLTEYIDPTNNEGENSQREGEKRVLKIPHVLFMEDDVNDVLKQETLFERESQLLKKLDHPNIPKHKASYQVPIFNGQTNVDVLAMEYIDGRSLEDIISKGERFDEEMAKSTLMGALSALNYVHNGLEAQVLHRDIKPSNLLIDKDGKAFLIDFNFSSLGNDQGISTVILNYGYYPIESSTGMYSQSTDLVALGNSVIAGLMGKSINDIREEQNKKSYDQADINELNISGKLKSFLRKLTHENASQRYQNALQAIRDLENLESISEDEMKQQVEKVMRGKGIERLIEEIRKKDRMFDFHVPDYMLKRFDDETLMKHLETVYRSDFFEVSDPEQIRKYALPGDKVIKTGSDLHGEVLIGSNNGQGVIKKVDSKRKKATVKFYNYGTREVDVDDLVILRSRSRNIPLRYRKTESVKMRERDGEEEYPDFDGRVYYVSYVGATEYAPPNFLKDSEGVIGKKDRSGKFEIIPISSRGNRVSYGANGVHTIYLGPEEFKLIVPNEVDLEEAKRKAMEFELEQTPKFDNGYANRDGTYPVPISGGIPQYLFPNISNFYQDSRFLTSFIDLNPTQGKDITAEGLVSKIGEGEIERGKIKMKKENYDKKYFNFYDIKK